MEKIIKLIAMRPVTFFILLTIAVLLLPSAVLPYWYNMMKEIEKYVVIEAINNREEIVFKIEEASKLIIPVNSSANNLARVLGSVLHDKPLSFSEIQNKVAWALFEAQLMLPQITQASYIGLDGLLFSYLIDNGKRYALYSNSSFSSNSIEYIWYTQNVNPNDGELNGEAKTTKPFIVTNEIWFERAMNSANGYASLGFQWRSKREGEPDLFLDTVRLGEIGVLSLGYSVKEVVDHFWKFDLHGGSLYMASLGDHQTVLLNGMIRDLNVSIDGAKALIIQGGNNNTLGEVSCKRNNDAMNGEDTTLDVGGTRYVFSCSQIHIARVPLVYVLAFPNHRLLNNVQNHTKVAMILVILMMVAMVISILAFVGFVVRAAKREVQLCAAYMKQMEKTAQAERKSMKQSLAFATANHDVRAYLGCIKGLISNSYSDVSPSSQLASNLNKMSTCVQDLLGLMNSILDFSKIEAGKMQLEQTEFNLAQLVEDMADLHHVVAMNKGVEVIFDTYDNSIMKFSHVKGDPTKLKQILGNLLSNAVKFTSEGHISIRVWAKKPSLENSIIASNKNSFLNRFLSKFSYKNKQAYSELEGMSTVKQDPNCMEFEFEVEDTGPGIPKDKRESIFENFVQVKENSSGQVGTGLGLGIVQSYVRLMGGDIEVVDKADGEKGTCFKFNIFLTAQEISPTKSPRQEDKTEPEDASPTSCVLRSPKVGASIVVIMMKNGERRRIVERYMESLGLKLVVIRQVNQLSRTLKRMFQSKLDTAQRRGLSPERQHLPLCAMDGCDDILPVYRKGKEVRCVLLILDANAGDFHVLRRSVAELRKDYHCKTCIKVVWLEKSETLGAHFPGLNDGALPSSDCIMSDPLHGSRLTRVVKLLPEFGGELQNVPNVVESGLSSEIQELVAKKERLSSFGRPLLEKKGLIVGSEETTKSVAKALLTSFGAVVDTCHSGKEAIELVRKGLKDCSFILPYDYILMEIEMEDMSGFEAANLIRTEEDKYGICIPIIGINYDHPSSGGERKVVQAGFNSYLDIPMTGDTLLQALRNAEKNLVAELTGEPKPKEEDCHKVKNPSSEKPLKGKRFLIAEDLQILRNVATCFLTNAGARVEECEDGKEAMEIICKSLNNMANGENSSGFPYDCVLMDCQMPVMNGFEATRRIRVEEKKYGVHIPIIALTADDGDEQVKMIMDSGMDFHLTKPLKIEDLAAALKMLHDNINTS